MADNVVEVIIRAKDQTAGAFKRLQTDIEGAKVPMLGLGATAAGVTAAMVGLATSVVQASDELLALSQQTGMAVEDLDRLGFAAGQLGTSMESLVSGMRFLQKNQVEDVSGNEKLVAAFGKLGVKQRELTRLNTERALPGWHPGSRRS